jgi:hypothetical protein
LNLATILIAYNCDWPFAGRFSALHQTQSTDRSGQFGSSPFFNYFTTHLIKIVTNEKKVYLTPGRQRCCLSARSYTPDDLDVVGHTYAGTTAARNDGKR